MKQPARNYETGTRGSPPCEITELANGLRVVVVRLPQMHRCHLGLWARVGSRFEAREDNGISHFLEHMIYRGTRRVPSAHAVNLAFERLGGSLFASTQVDRGIFSLTLPPESLDEACSLFGEVLSQPAFRDIDIERGIVLEEILEDLDDEGRQVDADNLSRELIYRNHPLGFTITGTDAHVRSFDESALRRWHLRHYTARNSVLVFAGPIDPDDGFRLAERDFGALAPGEHVAPEPPRHMQKRARLRIVDNVSSQTELRVCFRAFPEVHPLRPALDVLMRIIDDGMSARLYHRICDARGLCYDVSAAYDCYEDDGIVDVAAGVQHKRAALVTREVLAMFDELAREGPTVDELETARRRIAWDARALADSAEEAAAFYAGGLLFNRFSTAEEHVAELVGVQPGDVREAARELARPERLNVVAVGLLDGHEELEQLVKGWSCAPAA
ncbi:MAG: insulinase family protein [Myxococcota bacterium]|nr:insulinase family protein [Myxococcota bacterium]